MSDRNEAWAELLNEGRNLNYWAQAYGEAHAVARIRAALRDYDNANAR